VRVFSQKGIRIDQLSLEAKILYSAFCVMAVVALAVSIWYYRELIGDKGARVYYGGEVAPVSAPAETPGGLTIDLPPDEPIITAAPLIVPITKRKLLEVTHFHLFTVPVFLLILGHLFMLCRVPAWLRVGTLLTGVFSTALHMAAPWIAFAGGPGWAWLMPVSGTVMMVATLIMSLWPLVGMWRRAPMPSSPATR
jgi:hypothetical protein